MVATQLSENWPVGGGISVYLGEIIIIMMIYKLLMNKIVHNDSINAPTTLLHTMRSIKNFRKSYQKGLFFF